ncbi:MAG: hypothetical protein UE295_10080 [Acutalibacteraceae bacterium]|nr:hypothetical protein [Acutalibacteraceae bacterium]
MKKLASMLMLLVLVVSMAVAGAVSAFATVTELPADWNPTDYEYVVVANEGLLGDYAWQPTNEAFKMKYDETAGIWYLNLNGVANEGKDFDIFNSPLYRVVAVGYNKENPMELSFTKLGVAQDDRDYSDVYFDPSGDMKAHTLTITFDGQKASSFLDSPYVELPMAEESEYYLTGSAPLFAPVWSPNCEDYLMTKRNDNTYSLEISVTKDMWNSDIEYI